MNINQMLQQIDTYYSENRGGEAEQYMLECITRAAEQGAEDIMLQLLNELLGYYRETSRVEDSYAIAGQALGLARKMGLENTLHYATTLLNVANAYRAGGRLEESMNCYEQVRALYHKILTPDNMLIASLENNLSLLYQEMGDYRSAKESLLKALPIVQAKQADFEVAVTYANLASTCMELGEQSEAYEYALSAVELFESMGVTDFHYGAALASLGSFYFRKQDYGRAKGYFEKAGTIMEQSLGRNEYYQRLQVNVEECRRRMESAGTDEETEQGLTEMVDAEKGLDICRAYYEAYGRPMLAEQFSAYENRIAVGLVGEGSDCFGYDDEISRDHDWGPGFCMWVTEETYAEIGERLQAAYHELPKEFGGFKGAATLQGAGRRGVIIISDFYKRLLQTDSMGSIDNVDSINSIKKLDWQQVPDASLAAAVNGEVFRDDEGIFTGVREQLKQGYPKGLLYLKLAESAAATAQTLQYNYKRMQERGDCFTASMLLHQGLREAMKLKLYLEGKYPPHDKWLKRSVTRLPGGEQLVELLEKLSYKDGALQMAFRKEERHGMYDLMEELASLLVKDLYDRHFISDIESYLDAHTQELLIKASVADLSHEAMVQKIAELEFEAFDKVQNVGGRADCQNDWATFSIMRKSQYLTWNRTMLLQYYYDFQREYRRGHNLITEKYGRMMESTAPGEYEKIKDSFPALSPHKKAIIEEIVKLQVGWMDAFAAEYPHLADNARSIHTAEDNLYNTSYETYLRGEVSTYSDKMLELYGRYVVDYARRGENLTYDIMTNSVHLYGYKDLDGAERFLSL